MKFTKYTGPSLNATRGRGLDEEGRMLKKALIEAADKGVPIEITDLDPREKARVTGRLRGYAQTEEISLSLPTSPDTGNLVIVAKRKGDDETEQAPPAIEDGDVSVIEVARPRRGRRAAVNA